MGSMLSKKEMLLKSFKTFFKDMKISIFNKLFHEDLSIGFRSPLVLLNHKISSKSFFKLSDHFQNIFVFNFLESLLIKHDATAINFIYFICENIILYQRLETF